MPASRSRRPRSVIIGAGFAGIGMAIALKKAGCTDIVILEKNDGPGGTWRDNVYPGAGCDVPSHLYSYSFAANPDWSRKFSLQPEILAYIEKTAREAGITPMIRTQTGFQSAAWDDAAQLWRVRTDKGEELEAELLVSGTGQLNRPFTPEIPGAANFTGAQFHSARWDHSVDLAGKRIASIGNGASAVQYVPELIKTAAHVTVFQRSANWIVPRKDRAYSGFEKALFRYLPFFEKLERARIYLLLEKNFFAFRPGSFVSKLLAKGARAYLEASIADPKLRAALTPDYPVGCKRVLVSDDFYAALAQPHAAVVTEPISRITPGGIETRDGAHHKFDVIVWGTGFETTSILGALDVTGRNAVRLQDAWAQGPRSVLGITTAGFPNFVMLYGPNTNLGHNSIIFMIERQIAYAMKLIKEMQVRGAGSFDVSPAAVDLFQTQLKADLAKTVWATGCTSWYKTAAGDITNNWSGFTRTYAKATRNPEFSDYRFA